MQTVVSDDNIPCYTSNPGWKEQMALVHFWVWTTDNHSNNYCEQRVKQKDYK